MTTSTTAEPGAQDARPAPAGLPDPRIQPPTIAEAGDPFAVVRVIDLVARLDRGVPIRLDDVVDRLNAAWTDWLFTRQVVVDALVALQANWMADYRNASGIVIEDGPSGATVTIEDSSRVDPWIVRQAQRAAAECRQALDEFARRDRVATGG
jgi:hypothetical protein